MNILIFFIVLFVLILVHEWGHFIVAKKNGIRVDEFGIGFPPRLFGIKKGETEYTFNTLPIGGFVKIFGENAEEAFTQAPSQDGKSETETELGVARVNKLQKVTDYDRSFVAQSKLVQASVLIAGVAMNVLFAWILFSLVFAIGVPTSIDESEASDASRLVVSDVLSDGPAAAAGIPAGAVITGVRAGPDIDTILYPSSFSAFIEDHVGVETEVTYTIGEDEITTILVPVTGVIENSPDRPAVGVALALVDTVRMPPHIAVYEGLKSTIGGLVAIVVGISTLLVDSVRGNADFSSVAGPVGIVGLVGDAAEFGWASLMMFTAFISLNLAVINMLPIPALDGGRLMFVAVEAIRKKPVDPVWFARINFVGFALLMLLMLAVTISDITKLF